MFALAGCATDAVKPAPDVQTSTATVTVFCIDDKAPVRPELLADAEWAKTPADPDARVRALKVDRRRLLTYAKDLEATLAACKAP